MCRACSPKLCSRQGTGPGSYPALMTCEPTIGGKGVRVGKGIFLSPILLQGRQVVGQLSHAHTLSASSPALLPSGSALLCCPGEVQGLFSQVLQQIRDRDSIPALMDPWGQFSHSPLVVRAKWEGRRSFSSPTPLHSRQKNRAVAPTLTQPSGNSPTTPTCRVRSTLLPS